MQHEKDASSKDANSLGANSTGANSPGDWPDDPSEIADPEARAAYIDINRRLLASLVGLPRVCAVKKCRRRKRCFGAGQPYLAHHRGLIAARFEGALQRTGWDIHIEVMAVEVKRGTN